MLYCPNCGTKVKEDEYFCIYCGKALPTDMVTRIQDKKPISKWWFLPIISIVLIAIIVGTYAYILEHKSTKAAELYAQAETLLKEEKYEEANGVIQEALDHRTNFSQAQTLFHYTNEARKIDADLVEAKQLINDKEFSASLALITKMEEKLAAYHGPAVNNLVEKVDEYHSIAMLEELKEKLEAGLHFNELSILIWEAEEINHPEAEELAMTIRNRIVDYTFSRASEALNDHQYNNALLIAEDGLKYAPNAEKLQSLLTNINKEKLAFEAEVKDRMEQAMDTEHQINENDAIELVSVTLENDEDNHLVIQGEVKSNATVPIDSILVDYVLIRNDKEIATNEIFVFPDTLYPSETGKFEFTHFDLKDEHTRLNAEVKKITWYTN